MFTVNRRRLIFQKRFVRCKTIEFSKTYCFLNSIYSIMFRNKITIFFFCLIYEQYKHWMAQTRCKLMFPQRSSRNFSNVRFVHAYRRREYPSGRVYVKTYLFGQRTTCRNWYPKPPSTYIIRETCAFYQP